MKFTVQNTQPFVAFVCSSFENTWAEGLRSLQAELPRLGHSSMECWNQVDTDVSGSILASLDAGHHAGMTSMTKFAFSFSVGERKIMKHFVVRMSFVRCRNE